MSYHSNNNNGNNNSTSAHHHAPQGGRIAEDAEDAELLTHFLNDGHQGDNGLTSDSGRGLLNPESTTTDSSSHDGNFGSRGLRLSGPSRSHENNSGYSKHMEQQHGITQSMHGLGGRQPLQLRDLADMTLPRGAHPLEPPPMYPPATSTVPPPSHLHQQPGSYGGFQNHSNPYSSAPSRLPNPYEQPPPHQPIPHPHAHPSYPSAPPLPDPSFRGMPVGPDMNNSSSAGYAGGSLGQRLGVYMPPPHPSPHMQHALPIPAQAAAAQQPLSSLTREKLREQAAAEVKAAQQRDKLTGSGNWGDDGPLGDDDDSEDESADGKGGGRGMKRKGLSKEEKEKASRERNREHARNTRLRKKAYVAKLSQLVLDLSSQQEIQAREHALAASRQAERSAVRKSVVRSLLALHGSGDSDIGRWRMILDDRIVCVMPITPFRSFKPAEIVQSSRVLRGVDAMVADVCSMAVCIESIGCPSPRWKSARARGQRVTAAYEVGANDVHQADDVVMARWTFGTRNAVACGAMCECHVHGMLCCTFTEQNKVVSCEFVFDVMSFMQQLQCASSPPSPGSSALGADGGESVVDGNVSGEEQDKQLKEQEAASEAALRRDPVVPHTLQMACLASLEARVVTTAHPPYPVVCANAAWTALCGFEQDEVVGRPCSFLQGPATNPAEVVHFMRDVRAGRASSMTVVNYNKAGRPFQNFLRVYPLTSSRTSVEITHFLAVLEELPFLLGPPPPSISSFDQHEQKQQASNQATNMVFMEPSPSSDPVVATPSVETMEKV